MSFEDGTLGGRALRASATGLFPNVARLLALGFSTSGLPEALVGLN